MASVSLFLLALAMLYVGEAQESHLICKEISQVFQSQNVAGVQQMIPGPPGERGPIGMVGGVGPQGVKGDKGDKGDPGIVDYEIVNSTIDEKLNPMINKQATVENRTANLEETIEALQSNLSALQEKYEVLSRKQVRVPLATNIRLVGGNGNHEGRVEVLHLGEWGTICDDDWDILDAHVICRGLGFSGAAAAPGGARFGEGTGIIWLDEVQCSGDEEKIEQCLRNDWEDENCGHGEDASVICN